MTERVVVVVGAAAMGSIGHAVAVRAARDGYDVVVADIDRPRWIVPDVEGEAGWQGLSSVAAQIEALGRMAVTAHCDVTAAGEVEQLVAAAARVGPVHGLVNCTRAPIERAVSSLDLDDQTWRQTLAVNLTGALNCSRAVARHMIERGTPGSIVHISSLAGTHPIVGRTAYCTTKAALNMLTRVMALDLAPHGIRINVVAPGVIATHRWDPDEEIRARRMGLTLGEERAILLAAQQESIPLGRVGEAEDVANAVSFFLTDASAFVTGDSINVTGGQPFPIPPRKFMSGYDASEPPKRSDAAS